MPINQKGIDLIKHFEGKRLTGYLDPVGIPTIGYGHTGDGVKVGVTISEEKADQLLRTDLEKFASGVRDRLSVAVSGNAFAALASFAFNTGLGNFGKSTLRKKLNAGDAKGASKEFLKWVKGTINGNKITLPGLVRRRKAERRLFNMPDGADAAITPAEPTETAAEEAFFHIVRPGDTFGELAERNGLSIEALLTWNPHIADPNLLFPGDLVRFQGAPPVGGDPAPAAGDATEPAADAVAAAQAPWYGLAKREVGVSEVKGQLHNNNRILDYHRSTDLNKKMAAKDETPWCSSFVNWCVEGSGLKGTDSAMARSWLKWGEALETPREGCVIVFARPGAGPQAGHVGFYVRETAERIRVLGGNQSNQVKESNYGKKDLLGYRWPKGKPKLPAAEPVTGPAAEPVAEEDVFYLIQPGDTLRAIADRAGVTMDQVRAWNPQITNPNRIFPGDTILLVGTVAPAPEETPLPADSEAPWYDLARRELGTKEKAGSARNNPRILEYHASTTLPGNLARVDETAWCSSFVNWCVSRTGLEGTNSARARSWEKWGRKLTTPREGCIVVFSRPAGGPKAGHVGFYAGETATQIKVLGGNQSNRVKESNYSRNRLIGYRWPADVPTGVTGGSGLGLHK
ncbi:MAG: TIGR02594 family protein, partial [Hyphomicrobiales bacterium]|nr:TIGR02594 family protein [Hyphomicrobiales bacterium]